LSRDSSLHAQFKVGTDTYKKYFGRAPKGVWLPECAYRPGREEGDRRPPIDQFLYENGLEYFFTDFHAVEGGKTAGYRRQIGPYGTIDYIPMPERPSSGLNTFQGYWLPENPVAVFARNRKAGEQVWEADNGYPGDPWYREFHMRDSHSGMQYWRITGRTWDMAHKAYYDPKKAAERIQENSDHYVGLIHDMLKGYQAEHHEEGSIVVPFDTELFGHWWFEGVDWIKHVVRKMAKVEGIRRVTVSELIKVQEPSISIDLPESTWGAGGHYKVWMNPQVEFMWPIIHRCERRMEALVKRFPEPANETQRRALNQAARELLLLEGSDWPFLVTTGQAKAYAIDRFNEHVERFETLADALLAGAATEAMIDEIADIDNAFADIDYREFRDRQQTASAAS
jgi:1,4-alpha-glucan branching enzyme